MNHFIVDGNNLIGKISLLKKIQQKDKQLSREKLLFLLDRYFLNKKINVSLHLDGFPGEKLNSGKIKVIYSEILTADEKIKKQIENFKSRKSITVVTSDLNLSEFAKVCSCNVISSQNFAKLLRAMDNNDDEESRINQMNNKNEFLKLFGVQK